MVNEYKILLTKDAIKDKDKIKQKPALVKNVNNLIELLKTNPFQTPPPYEVSLGDLKGLYSRRINIQHRLVYKIDEEKKLIIIVSMWSHYEF